MVADGTVDGIAAGAAPASSAGRYTAMAAVDVSFAESFRPRGDLDGDWSIAATDAPLAWKYRPAVLSAGFSLRIHQRFIEFSLKQPQIHKS
jgi:hypothetical protein